EVVHRLRCIRRVELDLDRALVGLKRCRVVLRRINREVEWLLPLFSLCQVLLSSQSRNRRSSGSIYSLAMSVPRLPSIARIGPIFGFSWHAIPLPYGCGVAI